MVETAKIQFDIDEPIRNMERKNISMILVDNVSRGEGGGKEGDVQFLMDIEMDNLKYLIENNFFVQTVRHFLWYVLCIFSKLFFASPLVRKGISRV